MIAWLRYWLWHLRRIVMRPLDRAYKQGFERGYANGRYFSGLPLSQIFTPSEYAALKRGEKLDPWRFAEIVVKAEAAKAGPAPGDVPPSIAEPPSRS